MKASLAMGNAPGWFMINRTKQEHIPGAKATPFLVLSGNSFI
jgi:hypothetical protein